MHEPELEAFILIADDVAQQARGFAVGYARADALLRELARYLEDWRRRAQRGPGGPRAA